VHRHPPPIDWHAPATPEAHALNAILKSADQDDNLLDKLLGGRGLSIGHSTTGQC
jgi:hypothetical protein